MIEQGFHDLLANTSSISALVANRVSPIVLPEDSILPAVTYQIVGSQSQPTFATSGRQRMRVECNCWANNYLDAITLRAALIAALDGYQGQLSDGTNLQNTQQLQSIDFFDHDARQYRAMVEFHLYFD